MKKIKTYPYSTTLLFTMVAETNQKLTNQVKKMRELAKKNEATMLFPTTIGKD